MHVRVWSHGLEGWKWHGSKLHIIFPWSHRSTLVCFLQKGNVMWIWSFMNVTMNVCLPSGTCKDNLDQKSCDYYKKYGYCKTYVESMKYYCPKTCYSCGKGSIIYGLNRRTFLSFCQVGRVWCSGSISIIGHHYCHCYHNYYPYVFVMLYLSIYEYLFSHQITQQCQLKPLYHPQLYRPQLPQVVCRTSHPHWAPIRIEVCKMDSHLENRACKLYTYGEWSHYWFFQILLIFFH